jgi:lysozyme family protein
MADAKKIVPFILKWEAGTSKNPNDTAANFPVPDGSGVHTNKGITWGAWQAVNGGSDDSINRFYAMSENDWWPIFKIQYWDKVAGDNINSQRIADILANWAWGSGTSVPVIAVQKILGVKADGIAGRQTVAAINASTEADTFNKLKAENIAFFQKLGKLDKFKMFIKGWNNRLNDLYNNYVPAIKPIPLFTFILIGAAIYAISKNS